MFVRKIYNIIKKYRMFHQIKPFVRLNKNSVYDTSFKVDLRNPQDGQLYLTTGEHCVLSGLFVFESESGSINIGNRVHIGNSKLISHNSIKIDDDVTIAWDCLIYDHNSHSTEWEERKDDTEREYQAIVSGMNPMLNKDWNTVKSAPIHICSKAWIGVGCKILKGVTIGEGAVVAAGSVITKDVEAWTVVGGNPAQIIKRLSRGTK